MGEVKNIPEDGALSLPKGDALSLPKGWVETTLGEVCKIQSGSTPSTKNESFWNGAIPWITPKDLSTHNSVFIENGERNITELGLKNSSAQILPKNTILFTSRAPIGYIAIAENEVTTNQGFKNIICDEKKSHYKYFYYLMKYKTDYIKQHSSGSTFSEASASLVRSIEIVIPEGTTEQKSIAAILTAFDDKIELLQAQNKTLEETAQTIFKEWFGKYQIGDELPEGWRVGKLGDIVDFKNGKSRPKEEGQFPIYGGNGILGYAQKFNSDGNSIIIGRVGAYCGSIYVEDKPIWISDNAILGKEKLENHFGFILYYLKSLNLNSMAEGSSQPLLTQTLLNSLELKIPEKSVIFEFGNIISDINKKVHSNNIQIQTLTQTRNALLPKLMSGQIRVNDFKD